LTDAPSGLTDPDTIAEEAVIEDAAPVVTALGP
jgi:hypothetical protein